MRRTAPILALAMLLAGCGSSPKSVILTLDAAPPAPDAVHAGYRGLPIAVPAVHVPAALDRVEYARELKPGEIGIDDFARWSAPLGTLARDALVRDLTARLPAGSVLPPGDAGTRGKAIALDVTILSIAATGGGATMQAAWRRVPGGPVRQEVLSAPAPDGTPAGAAQTLGTLIGQLADRIAAATAG